MRQPMAVAALLSLLAGAACGGSPSAILDPASEAAAAIEWLWWVLLAVTLFVFMVVLAGFGFAVFRRRQGAGDDVEPEGRSLLWILIAGAIVPAFLLAGLTLATIRTSSRIAGAASGEGALLVEVVGHQFWWEVRYPESGAVTANEIHVPADRPVRLRLTSADVIHSVWIPRLQGKLDMTPGRTTQLLLRAEEPGIYRGFCAEFCGQQHALMGLRVVAQTEEEFARWLAHNAAPAAGTGPLDTAPLDTASPGLAPPSTGGDDPIRQVGEELFTRYDCNLCHRVRGAGFRQPKEDVGPDLTHVASRATLAAVTLENTPEHLTGWIRDPHQYKPGARMPATPMPDDELRALVRYLEGLR